MCPCAYILSVPLCVVCSLWDWFVRQVSGDSSGLALFWELHTEHARMCDYEQPLHQPRRRGTATQRSGDRRCPPPVDVLAGPDVESDSDTVHTAVTVRGRHALFRVCWGARVEGMPMSQCFLDEFGLCANWGFCIRYLDWRPGPDWEVDAALFPSLDDRHRSFSSITCLSPAKWTRGSVRRSHAPVASTWVEPAAILMTKSRAASSSPPPSCTQSTLAPLAAVNSLACVLVQGCSRLAMLLFLVLGRRPTDRRVSDSDDTARVRTHLPESQATGSLFEFLSNSGAAVPNAPLLILQPEMCTRRTLQLP